MAQVRQVLVADSEAMTRKRYLCLALIAGVLVLSACAAGPNDAAQADATSVAGFWLGLWHGAISPVTFVISLFNDKVGLYEVHNNGNWYDAGFILGVSIAFSSIGRAGATGSRGSRTGTGSRGRRADAD